MPKRMFTESNKRSACANRSVETLGEPNGFGPRWGLDSDPRLSRNLERRNMVAMDGVLPVETGWPPTRPATGMRLPAYQALRRSVSSSARVPSASLGGRRAICESSKIRMIGGSGFVEPSMICVLVTRA